MRICSALFLDLLALGDGRMPVFDGAEIADNGPDVSRLAGGFAALLDLDGEPRRSQGGSGQRGSQGHFQNMHSFLSTTIWFACGKSFAGTHLIEKAMAVTGFSRRAYALQFCSKSFSLGISAARRSVLFGRR